MKKINQLSLACLVLLTMLAFSDSLNAQPTNPSTPAPIDGGVVLLAAAGAGLGYKKYKKLRHE